MESTKKKITEVYVSVTTTLDFQTIIVFLISALLTFGLFMFFVWLFTSPSASPTSSIPTSPSSGPPATGRFPIIAPPSSPPSSPQEPPTYRGLKTTNKSEVFNVKDNAYRYPEAEDCCRRYNARVATQGELLEAQKAGANWYNLGWLAGQDAYYPLQAEQLAITSKWPTQLQSGKVGINGGFYPSQLKLSVNCYGTKPVDVQSIQNLHPWNTVTNKWSQYS